MPNIYERFKVDLPEGKSGDWEINKFTVPEGDLKALRYALHGRPVPPGDYTRLLYQGKVIMSDTPAEIEDHYDAIQQAAGRVLINGLGLGVVLKAILRKRDVTHVDVVELSPDVIKLVAPYYQDSRLVIHQADAFTKEWPRGTRWNLVWHDIWPDISPDNLEGMIRLHRKYGHRCESQASWQREECERYRREDQRQDKVLGWLDKIYQVKGEN